MTVNFFSLLSPDKWWPGRCLLEQVCSMGYPWIDHTVYLVSEESQSSGSAASRPASLLEIPPKMWVTLMVTHPPLRVLRDETLVASPSLEMMFPHLKNPRISIRRTKREKD